MTAEQCHRIKTEHKSQYLTDTELEYNSMAFPG